MIKLESLTLTSFESITDKSISEIVKQLKYLNTLCLRDNCKLTIKTLEACVELAYLNPNRTFNIHIDEKQLSPSKLMIEYARSYIRDIWHTCKEDMQLNQFKDQQIIGADSTESLVQIQESLLKRKNHKWPTNLNVVIDANFR